MPSALPVIRSVGISIWDPIWSERDHIGPNTELVHIIRGDVLLHIRDRRYRGREGDTLVIPAGAPHRDAFAPGSVFQVLHVMFEWPRGLPGLRPGLNADLVRLPAPVKQTLKELLSQVYDDFRRPEQLSARMTAASLLRALFFMLDAVQGLRARGSRATTAVSASRGAQLIEEAKRYIRDHLHEPVALAGIAAHLGISAFHLSHLFSQESGFTLSAYLQHERMRRAADLLADPAQRIRQVGFAVGFQDANYFGKAFRRYFGETPGSFRARLSAGRRKKLP